MQNSKFELNIIFGGICLSILLFTIGLFVSLSSLAYGKCNAEQIKWEELGLRDYNCEYNETDDALVRYVLALTSGISLIVFSIIIICLIGCSLLKEHIDNKKDAELESKK